MDLSDLISRKQEFHKRITGFRGAVPPEIIAFITPLVDKWFESIIKQTTPSTTPIQFQTTVEKLLTNFKATLPRIFDEYVAKIQVNKTLNPKERDQIIVFKDSIRLWFENWSKELVNYHRKTTILEITQNSSVIHTIAGNFKEICGDKGYKLQCIKIGSHVIHKQGQVQNIYEKYRTVKPPVYLIDKENYIGIATTNVNGYVYALKLTIPDGNNVFVLYIVDSYGDASAGEILKCTSYSVYTSADIGRKLTEDPTLVIELFQNTFPEYDRSKKYNYKLQLVQFTDKGIYYPYTMDAIKNALQQLKENIKDPSARRELESAINYAVYTGKDDLDGAFRKNYGNPAILAKWIRKKTPAVATIKDPIIKKYIQDYLEELAKFLEEFSQSPQPKHSVTQVENPSTNTPLNEEKAFNYLLTSPTIIHAVASSFILPYTTEIGHTVQEIRHGTTTIFKRQNQAIGTTSYKELKYKKGYEGYCTIAEKLASEKTSKKIFPKIATIKNKYLAGQHVEIESELLYATLVIIEQPEDVRAFHNVDRTILPDRTGLHTDYQICVVKKEEIPIVKQILQNYPSILPKLFTTLFKEYDRTRGKPLQPVLAAA